MSNEMNTAAHSKSEESSLEITSFFRPLGQILYIMILRDFIKANWRKLKSKPNKSNNREWASTFGALQLKIENLYITMNMNYRKQQSDPWLLHFGNF